MEARTWCRPGGGGGPARRLEELLESAQNATFTSKYERTNNQTLMVGGDSGLDCTRWLERVTVAKICFLNH